MDTAILRTPPCIQPTFLAALLGRAATPMILDVRRTPKFVESPRMVCASIRVPPEEIEAFARSHTARDVVVYCVYGHNVSTEAALSLRAMGWPASTLAGGIEGGKPPSAGSAVHDLDMWRTQGLAALRQRATALRAQSGGAVQPDGSADTDSAENLALWRAQPVPTIRKRPDWGVTGEHASRWVTRAGPKIDRIACPWLITRFIDPRAEFFYVPTAQVFSEAERLGAVAYDIPGAPVSHTGESGVRCSFDALLEGFDLHLNALNLLANIVRGADTDRLDLAPQCAGLLAASLGMSALHADDDHAMLAAMVPVYDALYAWCVQSVAGRAERHHWKLAA
jgi:rhodanese-related sulfurtransferase